MVEFDLDEAREEFDAQIRKVRKDARKGKGHCVFMGVEKACGS